MYVNTYNICCFIFIEKKIMIDSFNAHVDVMADLLSSYAWTSIDEIKKCLSDPNDSRKYLKYAEILLKEDHSKNDGYAQDVAAAIMKHRSIRSWKEVDAVQSFTEKEERVLNRLPAEKRQHLMDMQQQSLHNEDGYAELLYPQIIDKLADGSLKITETGIVVKVNNFEATLDDECLSMPSTTDGDITNETIISCGGQHLPKEWILDTTNSRYEENLQELLVRMGKEDEMTKEDLVTYIKWLEGTKKTVIKQSVLEEDNPHHDDVYDKIQQVYKEGKNTLGPRFIKGILDQFTWEEHEKIKVLEFLTPHSGTYILSDKKEKGTSWPCRQCLILSDFPNQGTIANMSCKDGSGGILVTTYKTLQEEK